MTIYPQTEMQMWVSKTTVAMGICMSTMDSRSKQMNCSFALSQMAFETSDWSLVDVSVR